MSFCVTNIFERSVADQVKINYATGKSNFAVRFVNSIIEKRFSEMDKMTQVDPDSQKVLELVRLILTNTKEFVSFFGSPKNCRTVMNQIATELEILYTGLKRPTFQGRNAITLLELDRITARAKVIIAEGLSHAHYNNIDQLLLMLELMLQNGLNEASLLVDPDYAHTAIHIHEGQPTKELVGLEQVYGSLVYNFVFDAINTMYNADSEFGVLKHCSALLKKRIEEVNAGNDHVKANYIARDSVIFIKNLCLAIADAVNKVATNLSNVSFLLERPEAILTMIRLACELDHEVAASDHFVAQQVRSTFEKLADSQLMNDLKILATNYNFQLMTEAYLTDAEYCFYVKDMFITNPNLYDSCVDSIRNLVKYLSKEAGGVYVITELEDYVNRLNIKSFYPDRDVYTNITNNINMGGITILHRNYLRQGKSTLSHCGVHKLININRESKRSAGLQITEREFVDNKLPKVIDEQQDCAWNTVNSSFNQLAEFYAPYTLNSHLFFNVDLSEFDLIVLALYCSSYYLIDTSKIHCYSLGSQLWGVDFDYEIEINEKIKEAKKKKTYSSLKIDLESYETYYVYDENMIVQSTLRKHKETFLDLKPNRIGLREDLDRSRIADFTCPGSVYDKQFFMTKDIFNLFQVVSLKKIGNSGYPIFCDDDIVKTYSLDIDQYMHFIRNKVMFDSNYAYKMAVEMEPISKLKYYMKNRLRTTYHLAEFMHKLYILDIHRIYKYRNEQLKHMLRMRDLLAALTMDALNKNYAQLSAVSSFANVMKAMNTEHNTIKTYTTDKFTYNFNITNNTNPVTKTRVDNLTSWDKVINSIDDSYKALSCNITINWSASGEPLESRPGTVDGTTINSSFFLQNLNLIQNYATDDIKHLKVACTSEEMYVYRRTKAVWSALFLSSLFNSESCKGLVDDLRTKLPRKQNERSESQEIINNYLYSYTDDKKDCVDILLFKAIMQDIACLSYYKQDYFSALATKYFIDWSKLVDNDVVSYLLTYSSKNLNFTTIRLDRDQNILEKSTSLIKNHVIEKEMYDRDYSLLLSWKDKIQTNISRFIGVREDLFTTFSGYHAARSAEKAAEDINAVLKANPHLNELFDKNKK